MAIRDLGPWLLSNPAFVEQLEGITALTVASDMGNAFSMAESIASVKPDWGYLLLCGSILAISEDGNCQAAALRIAHGCLTDLSTPAERRDSAGVLLDTLANHPTLDLAIRRKLLAPGLRDRLPVGVRIDWTRRSIQDAVVAGGRVLRVNAFQKKFWNSVEANDWLSVSAPTAAGKSFIVNEWVSTYLSRLGRCVVVYLVPTRALISQVERDLRRVLTRHGVGESNVVSAPVPTYLEEANRNVLVFTQERLQILLANDPRLRVDVLIVDEAHKLGDTSRGVLLEQVIESLTLRNSKLKVIFASPMSGNPEVLIDDHPDGARAKSLTSDDITVSQNLIWVTQQPGDSKKWAAHLCLSDKTIPIGTFPLPASPIPSSKRLPFVAWAIGNSSYGNVVYVNGAADAEKAATQLYDLSFDINDSAELNELIKLSEQIVHPQFLLQKCLRRGIAFHYGNLPLILREEIERLFSEGVIRFLVCTSTLVEGVNMSCRNIFMRGPKRGKNHLMTQEDFWNLAGRAGRWGKEFQGNIVCVDAADASVWGPNGAPRLKTKFSIRRATDASIDDIEAFAAYIEDGAPALTRSKRTGFEATFSYLCTVQDQYGSAAEARWARRHSAETVVRVGELIRSARGRIRVPSEIIGRNPGISPFAMDQLLLLLRDRAGDLEGLLPSDPGSDDAVQTLVRIFGRCGVSISPSIGPIPKRQFSLALLVSNWMRGYPLARLILDRIANLEKRNEAYRLPSVIRSVMEDVEQIARFEAPRAMACYRDIASIVLLENGRQDLVDSFRDLSLNLEYGVSQATQVSLITSGLSRSSTIALSEIIGADSLTKDQVREWLVQNERLWRESDLSALVKREVDEMLVR